ncbi:DUF6194 family protein [Pseudonocardia kujensis]|uniref:DUF6194 family protein n=1 Tax=Pseudonocardia kujensis TaxID=1128675 RepID=UPI001E63CA63|nr:DUF6194 family protein [Pseudonocardia kujensis]MCE0764401.1 DUF6194 family protein [Pseudonocardia kujensis]
MCTTSFAHWITLLCSVAEVDLDGVREALAAFPDTLLVEATGDIYAIYDPDDDYAQRPRHGWATVVTSNANDSASDLDRPGVYRLNIGLPRDRFHELLDPRAEHDMKAIDILLPHPIYGGQNWVCVLNPDRTWPLAQQLLVEAHAFAVRKHNNAARRRSQHR